MQEKRTPPSKSYSFIKHTDKQQLLSFGCMLIWNEWKKYTKQRMTKVDEKDLDVGRRMQMRTDNHNNKSANGNN
ncbi:hypothetical protein ACJIZ3_024579 [Penstemon smallii]|uniref:Uncharacterized protein n=1 Tax=Penstemon smallii TaxID=265156 RepID=A0ABD3TVF3_9LAMI